MILKLRGVFVGFVFNLGKTVLTPRYIGMEALC